MEEKKVPALRFRGFDNAWEQCKLRELSEKTYGGGTPSTANAEYWCGNIPWLQSSDIIDGKLFDVTPKKYISQVGLKSSAAQLIPENSIAIITRVGVGKLAFLSFFYTTSQDFLSMSRLTTEPYFTVYACYKKLQSELNSVQGTSIKGITKDELLAKEIKVPSYDEQKQIGEYFTNLDHLISLHQRKLEMLKKVKKSMLEKMFPKNDAKVPEVRFSDFTDAWEQRRLGELGHTEGGTSIESEFDSEGKYKVISIGSYSEESDYVDQGIRAIESEKTLRRVLQKNDLTMILNDKTSSGKIIGRVLFIDRSDVFVYNQRTEMIRGYEDRYYPKFLYHLLNAPIQRKKIVKQSQGNTQIYVNWSKVSETQYMIPEVGEQTIISNYFSYFDHLISLHQRKLEKLKNIKKSMLEKMFI